MCVQQGGPGTCLQPLCSDGSRDIYGRARQLERGGCRECREIASQVTRAIPEGICCHVVVGAIPVGICQGPSMARAIPMGICQGRLGGFGAIPEGICQVYGRVKGRMITAQGA